MSTLSTASSATAPASALPGAFRSGVLTALGTWAVVVAAGARRLGRRAGEHPRLVLRRPGRRRRLVPRPCAVGRHRRPEHLGGAAPAPARLRPHRRSATRRLVAPRARTRRGARLGAWCSSAGSCPATCSVTSPSPASWRCSPSAARRCRVSRPSSAPSSSRWPGWASRCCGPPTRTRPRFVRSWFRRGPRGCRSSGGSAGAAPACSSRSAPSSPVARILLAWSEVASVQGAVRHQPRGRCASSGSPSSRCSATRPCGRCPSSPGRASRSPSARCITPGAAQPGLMPLGPGARRAARRGATRRAVCRVLVARRGRRPRRARGRPELEFVGDLRARLLADRRRGLIAVVVGRRHRRSRRRRRRGRAARRRGVPLLPCRAVGPRPRGARRRCWAGYGSRLRREQRRGVAGASRR